MFAKGKIGKILKASGLAFAWVLVITYTTFPQLLENPLCFLAEQGNFENMGKFLLFGIGIYTFDLLAQIMYFPIDEQIRKSLLVVGTLGCVVFCVLIVPFAINLAMSRIYPVLLVAVPMGLLKGFNFYISDESKNDEPLPNRFQIINNISW
jgi:hypothetical protein